MAEEIEISLQIGASHCDQPCSSSSAGILVGGQCREQKAAAHRRGHCSSSSSFTTADDKLRTVTECERAEAAAASQCSTAIAAGDNSAEMAFYLSDSSTNCSCSSSSSSSCPSSASCLPPPAGTEKVATVVTCKSIVAEQTPQQWWPNKPDAKWKVRTLGLLAAILPAVGCYFCLAYTFVFQFDRVANFTIPSTICPGLKSMFPPVSYSIGVWKPQKYIWLMVLSMHIPPRFFYSIVHKSHYAMGESEYRQRRWFPQISRLHYVLLVVEAFGLLAVSVIDIESHFRVHAVCFAFWLIPFNFNMLFNNMLHYHSGINQLKRTHDRVFRIKCALFMFGYPISVSTAISYCTFLLTCSTFAYATFSVAEYFLIGINSLFYFLVVWEFEGSKVEVYIKHRQHQSSPAEK